MDGNYLGKYVTRANRLVVIDSQAMETRQLAGTLEPKEWLILRGMLFAADGVTEATRTEWVVDPGANCIAKLINPRGTSTDQDLIQRVAVAA